MSKRKIGYLLIGLIVVILIVKFSFKDEIDKIIKGTDKKTEKRTDKVSNKLIIRKDVIKEIKTFYNLAPHRSVVVTPILNDWVHKKTILFNYEWFVNDNKIENDKKLLSKKFIKKGDEVYCIIKPRNAKTTLNSVKSKLITIKNLPPKIKYKPSPRFNDMGLFVYKINAIDVDGDKLTYSLINPDEGMTINRLTGVIDWNIQKTDLDDSELEEDLSSYNIIIDFKVTDSEGAETLGSITFNTATGSEGGEE